VIERQDIVVQDRDRRLRLLGHVQEAEGVGAEGVDHGVQVDPADALQGADHEGIRGQELTRPLAFDMALAEAGIELLEEGRLLRGQLDRLIGVRALQRQPALVAGAQAWSLRIFWMVIAETRRPSRASSASSRLQP
jgi:hypothetical protein